MLKIQIEDNLYIESDAYQYILKQYMGTFDKDGKENYKTLGYYSKLQDVVMAVLRKKIAQSQAKTLKELLREIDRVEAEIKEIIRR